FAPSAWAPTCTVVRSVDKSVQPDENGQFSLSGIPIGRQTVVVNSFGYEARSQAIELNSAKEAVLQFGLLESAVSLDEVSVTATAAGQAKNEMATVSSRQFSVEETNLYAGSRGEPARMATNFAGVQGSDDQRNDLVVRGNTPSGVLYRMEGINIPNPNHFSIPGTGGGPVTILNNKFLANSDFFTGAWPAEYGNAIAGVFDLQMRDGNNQKFEGSAQLGLLGTELMLEGPLGKGAKAPSFLAVYRYSTLSLFQSLNINLGTNAIPRYQDGAFRLTFPQKNGGKIAAWGMFGVSDIDILISEQTDTSGFESYGSTDRDQYFGSDMFVGGVNYSKPINKSSFFKVGVAASTAVIRAVNTKLQREIGDLGDGTYGWLVTANDTMLNYTFRENKLHGFMSYNKKLSTRSTLQAGINVDLYMLNYQDSVKQFDGTQPGVVPPWRKQWNTQAAWPVVQPYVSYKNRLNEKTTFTAGATALYLGVNKKSLMPLEPRVGLSYQATVNDRLFIGSGLHAQGQAPYLYYYAMTTQNFDPLEHNVERIGLMKSAQIAGGWERTYKGLPVRTKIEAYYQHLYDIPVEVRPSAFSMLNAGSGFGRIWPDTLQNTGVGRNYGVEFTAERFFAGGIYFLATGSLFDAKYKGSDEVWRNTIFNGRYAFNLLAAKEFKLGPNNRFTLGGKFTTVGGRWFGTTVDQQATLRAGEIVFAQEGFNEKQYRAYQRLDLKLGYKWNYPNLAWEFGLDISNLTGAKNILTLTYVPGLDNPNTTDLDEGIREEYQLGLFPVFYLRCDF
ncbi:MAG: carboxypeptidase-like regulatory domain-containing protein, partial [Schleiferiaceae bacterium]